MAVRDPGVLPAAVVTLEGGMSSDLDPRLLEDNQAPLLVNTSLRGALPRCRPGWKKLDLSYDTGIESAVTTGRFQGATVYTPRVGLPALVASIGGRQFRFNVWHDESVQEISIPSDYNPSTALQVWFAQAEEFLVMQDGQSAPWCFNGAAARRLGVQELPTGTIMEYALGRMWIASPTRYEFVAGDLVYSSSGTPAYGYRDAVLKFTENDFLNEGGAFAVPVDGGPINAIRFIPNLDTSLGQGPIEVFTTNGAFSISAPFDRTVWKSVEYPIQTVSASCPGALSQYSTVRVNGDIWYRGTDGVRSFIVARRDFNAGWGNTPMSEEMKRLLEYDSTHLLQYSSSVVFDNRLLITATPLWNADHGVFHRALAVLDFDSVSSMFGKTSPTWSGMWTGLSVLQLVKGEYQGVERCFAFVFNEDDEEIELWELTTDYPFDNDGVNDLRIKWGFETKLFDYGQPNGLKRLERADIAPSDIQGEVDFTIKFRSDEDPCWTDWNSFELCATDSNCAPTGCLDLSTYQKSYRARVTLPAPPDGCNSSNNTRTINGFRHQVRVEVVGQCAIKQLVLFARQLQEAPFNGCQPSTASCTSVTCCPEDDYFQSQT